MVLNTLENGGQALIFASTRKNAVSAAKTVASHMDKVLVPKSAPKLVKTVIRGTNKKGSR